MKKAIAIKDLRKNLSVIADRVEKGESFDVFRRSKLCARIIPAGQTMSDEWETVIDFTEECNPKGIKVEDVLKALKTMPHG